MRYEEQRDQVAATACELLDSGLIVNTSGNVSVRIDDHVAITPSGRDYRSLTTDDIAIIDLQGEVLEGNLLPSSETPLHLAVYRAAPSVTAIVHAHSVYVTALSTLVDELPAIHYQMAELGGTIRVAPYRTFGSDELAEVTSEALSGRSAVIMKNHGSLTVADTPARALSRCITLEWCARVYLKALASGTPNILSAEQMLEAKAQMERFDLKRKAFEPPGN